MIKEIIMHQIYCDNCQKLCNDEMVFNEISAAIEDSQECDWQVFNGKHYCPECYSWDSDDNLIIDKNRTK